LIHLESCFPTACCLLSSAVCVCVYLSIYIYIYLSIYLSIYIAFNLPDVPLIGSLSRSPWVEVASNTMRVRAYIYLYLIYNTYIIYTHTCLPDVPLIGSLSRSPCVEVASNTMRVRALSRNQDAGGRASPYHTHGHTRH
jgi:hypothetical protein